MGLNTMEIAVEEFVRLIQKLKLHEKFSVDVLQMVETVNMLPKSEANIGWGFTVYTCFMQFIIRKNSAKKIKVSFFIGCQFKECPKVT